MRSTTKKYFLSFLRTIELEVYTLHASGCYHSFIAMELGLDRPSCYIISQILYAMRETGNVHQDLLRAALDTELTDVLTPRKDITHSHSDFNILMEDRAVHSPILRPISFEKRTNITDSSAERSNRFVVWKQQEGSNRLGSQLDPLVRSFISLTYSSFSFSLRNSLLQAAEYVKYEKHNSSVPNVIGPNEQIGKEELVRLISQDVQSLRNQLQSTDVKVRYDITEHVTLHLQLRCLLVEILVEQLLNTKLYNHRRYKKRKRRQDTSLESDGKSNDRITMDYLIGIAIELWMSAVVSILPKQVENFTMETMYGEYIGFT